MVIVLYVDVHTYSRTWIVSTHLRESKIGTPYQRYLLSKAFSVVLHEVGTEQ